MATINPYISFDGSCEAAFNFYKSVFGGEFSYVGRYKDMPAGETEEPIADSEKEKIMHISLPISKETILMGSDMAKGCGPEIEVGNNFSISIDTKSEEEAKRIFEGLSAGGTSVMPLEKTFWGALFGMFVDKFGITWLVNYDYDTKE